MVRLLLRTILAAGLLLGPSAIAPAVAAGPQEPPRSEAPVDPHTLLPEERARLQSARAYDVMTLAAIAGGAAVLAGAVTGSPVAALAVAGAVVASYVSLP